MSLLKTIKLNARYTVNILRGHPSSVSLELTYRCNLRCIMCNVWRKGADSAKDELTTEELIRVIDELYYELGVRIYRLVGAEPFARTDLFELIAHIKSLPETEVHVVTNGVFTDAEAARRLVELRLDYYKVSLDGVGEVNDRVRGMKGGYNKAVAGIKHINEAKAAAATTLPHIHILTTITDRNEDDFAPLFDLREELGIANYNLGPAWQLDRETAESSVIEGDVAVTDRFVPIDEPWRPSEEVHDKIAAAGNPLGGNLLERIIDRLLSPFIGTMRRHPAWNCHYRMHTIIDPVGDVIICPVLDGYPLGNVRFISLKSILSGKRMRAFAKTHRGEALPACAAICGGRMRQEAPRADIRNIIYYVINRWGR
jgi:MoaA/NifB/PqqE/SkfB family radical SAM enzyme